MFKDINNSIPSSTIEIVDNSVVDNPGCANKIWELDELIDQGYGEPINVSRG